MIVGIAMLSEFFALLAGGERTVAWPKNKKEWEAVGMSGVNTRKLVYLADEYARRSRGLLEFAAWYTIYFDGRAYFKESVRFDQTLPVFSKSERPKLWNSIDTWVVSYDDEYALVLDMTGKMPGVLRWAKKGLDGRWQVATNLVRTR